MTSPSSQFCGSCGQPLTYGSLFCEHCGTAASSAPGVHKIGVHPAVPAVLPQRSAESGPGSAAFGSRVGAYLMDVLAAGLMGVAAVAFVLFLPNRSWYIPAAIGLTGLLVFLILEALGTSVGKAVLGIKVVRADTGGRPRVGRGVGRFLLRQVLIGVTLSVAGFSPLWDSTGQRRAWWDKAFGTVVVPKDAVRSSSHAVTPVAASDRLDLLCRPDWARPTEQSAPDPHLRSSAVGALWSDRPARQAGVSAISQPNPVGPPLLYDGMPVPWADAQSPGSVISSVPGGRRADSASERTSLRTPNLTHERASAWLLHLDNGQTVELTGPVIIGRDPSVEDGESPAVAVPIADETRSVSKTHLRVEPAADIVSVTDRFSTNGVAVIVAGAATACLPGVPTAVPDSAVVRFGDRELRISRKYSPLPDHLSQAAAGEGRN